LRKKSRLSILAHGGVTPHVNLAHNGETLTEEAAVTLSISQCHWMEYW
jgi:hypothetical protein